MHLTGVELEMQGDVDETAGGNGAFDVAAHPEHRVGYAAEHQGRHGGISLVSVGRGARADWHIAQTSRATVVQLVRAGSGAPPVLGEPVEVLIELGGAAGRGAEVPAVSR